MPQIGFFDMENRLHQISQFGDPLEKISQVVDFELFRPQLEEAFSFTSDTITGGRPPWDAVLILKVLLLQSLYNISDDQAEYQIKDRLSFMRFLGIELADRVPDAKTIWLYRDRLQKGKLMETLFQTFDQHLKERGYLAMSGQIVDATIVQAPRQRLTKEEKADLKSGKTPGSWEKNQAKKRQKDTDAKWIMKTKKAKDPKTQVDIGIPEFGYKNHISIDQKHKFVRRFKVTDASKYDGHVFEDLLDPSNTASSVWGDKAYHTQKNETLLKEKGLRSQLHRKKPQGKPMPQHISRGNSTRSKVRACVEHVFATQKCRMDLFIRTIGLKRAEVKIGLANLGYNLKQLVFLESQTGPPQGCLAG